jgi:hypothetical protein
MVYKAPRSSLRKGDAFEEVSRSLDEIYERVSPEASFSSPRGFV